MSSDVTMLVVLGVLTIAGTWLVIEMIEAVRELRRQATEEDDQP